MHHGDGRLPLVHHVLLRVTVRHPGVVAAVRWHVHGHALMLSSHMRESAIIPISTTPLAPEVAHAHPLIALAAAVMVIIAAIALLRGPRCSCCLEVVLEPAVVAIFAGVPGKIPAGSCQIVSKLGTLVSPFHQL